MFSLRPDAKLMQVGRLFVPMQSEGRSRTPCLDTLQTVGLTYSTTSLVAVKVLSILIAIKLWQRKHISRIFKDCICGIVDCVFDPLIELRILCDCEVPSRS